MMMHPKNCFYAKSSWQDKDGKPHNEEIIFFVEGATFFNVANTIKAVWRWVKDRQIQAGDDYAKLINLEIGSHRIGKIDSKGWCESQRYRPCYDWSHNMSRSDELRKRGEQGNG